MSDEQKQLIRENGIKELSEEVNGKPLNFVIGQYVERKDVGGLAEFFRAYISDAKETLEKYVDLAIKQTEEGIVREIEEKIKDLDSFGINDYTVTYDVTGEKTDIVIKANEVFEVINLIRNK